MLGTRSKERSTVAKQRAALNGVGEDLLLESPPRLSNSQRVNKRAPAIGALSCGRGPTNVRLLSRTAYHLVWPISVLAPIAHGA